MSKKYTVYLRDEEAERLEAETSTKASPGKVIKERLLASWNKEDTAPVVLKQVKTDSIFTKDGDEVKRHVSDNDVAMFKESIVEPKPDPDPSEPSLVIFSHHAKVLQTISDKKEQRTEQFVRSEIVKESKAPGNVVDDVIKKLLLGSRIKKVGYNTYAWNSNRLLSSEESEERIEPIVDFLKQNKGWPN